MEKSFDELHHLFELMNRRDKDIIFKGSRHPMPEADKAVISSGVQRIIELALEAKKDGEFMCIDELQQRSKIGKSVTELLRKFGCLEGMSQSSQMSLFG